MNEIKTFFSKSYEQYGQNVKSLGWGSEYSQTKRFEKILQIGIKNGDSLLDVGCGFGDFYSYLKNFIDINYFGIDLSADFIKIARQKYGQNNFQVLNVLDYSEKSDWVICSGIFSIKPCNIDYIKQITTHMFDISKKGIAFNCLSNLTPYTIKENMAYFSPCEILQNVVTVLTTCYSLHHDYLENDFTYFLFKDESWKKR